MAGLSVLSRRRTRVVAGGLVSAGLVVGSVFGGGSAFAAAPNWWVDAYRIGQAQVVGWMGEGVKIAVIDDQIDPTLEKFEGTCVTVDKRPVCSNRGAGPVASDQSGDHADTITSILVGHGRGSGRVSGTAPDASVVFYGYGHGTASGCRTPGDERYSGASQRAADAGAKITTTSVGWPIQKNKAPADEIACAVAGGVVLIYAVPDDSTQRKITPSPQVYNGVVSVNAVDSSCALMADSDTGGSNVGPNVTLAAAGVGMTRPTDGNPDQGGSPFPAPLVAGMVADPWEMFPTATGDQRMQLLVQTENSPGGAEEYGHGVASLANILAGDPLKYPDANPVVAWGFGIPTVGQMKAAARKAPGAATGLSSVVVGVSVGVGVLVRSCWLWCWCGVRGGREVRGFRDAI